jgi:hypothetical protein
MENRAQWEIHVMFISWLACLLCPLLRPVQKGWHELLWVAAAAFGLLPIVNALTTDRHLINSIKENDWVFIGADSIFIATGLLCAFAAYQLQRGDKQTVATTSAAKNNPISEAY